MVIPTLAFVFSLKVFAICVYPNAIASAVTSSSDAPPPPPPPPEAFTTVIPVAPTVAVILLLKFNVVAIPAGVPLFCIKTPVETPTLLTRTSVVLFMSP